MTEDDYYIEQEDYDYFDDFVDDPDSADLHLNPLWRESYKYHVEHIIDED